MNYLSPDASRGLAVRQQLFDEVVSTKTIYHYITLQRIPVKNMDLPLRVRRQTYGKSIDERGEKGAERKKFGQIAEKTA